ncbi:arginase family protein [Rhizobium oryzicola]|uniref:Arginase family protein n=1 Tax=Rhizobium oryzicola TaxID=1232668 RepID=A0ABT8SXF6_9HYPH|nr:arginase family protein [Rhizobium oryzicola]MDO1583142.1 arginase family protein [Rhizobium oryzicola]
MAKSQGVRIIYMEGFIDRGPQSVTAEVKDICGGPPAYLTFDIDSTDPSMAPRFYLAERARAGKSSKPR